MCRGVTWHAAPTTQRAAVRIAQHARAVHVALDTAKSANEILGTLAQHLREGVGANGVVIWQATTCPPIVLAQDNRDSRSDVDIGDHRRAIGFALSQAEPIIEPDHPANATGELLLFQHVGTLLVIEIIHRPTVPKAAIPGYNLWAEQLWKLIRKNDLLGEFAG